MREVVILLLVVVLAIMVVGAVNQDQHVDFDYVVGTWDNASVLELSAVAAGVVFVTGLTCAAIVRGGLIGSRRKLERELQETYVRLRAAESRTQVPPDAPATGSGSAAATAPAVPIPAEAVSADEPPPPSPADAERVHLAGPEAPEITERTEFPPDEPALADTAATPGAEETAVLPARPVEDVTVEMPAAEDQTIVARPPGKAGETEITKDDASADDGPPAGSTG